MKVVKMEGSNSYKVVHEPEQPRLVSIPSPEELADLCGEDLEKLAIRAAFAKESFRHADARVKQAELARAHKWLLPAPPPQPLLSRGMIWMLGATCLLLAIAMLTTALRPTLARGRPEVAPYGPPPPPAVGQGRAP